MEVIDIINECVDTTLKMHPANKEEAAINALSEIVNRNNYSYFTRSNGARQRMSFVGRDALVVELIRGALISREIQQLLGEAREIGIGKQGYPENIQQTQNYIFNRISQEDSPSNVYSEVARSSYLCGLLVDNYANLIATTTKQDQNQALASLSYQIPQKLKTLDNLQQVLIDQNQTRIIEAQSQAQNNPMSMGNFQR